MALTWANGIEAFGLFDIPGAYTPQAYYKFGAVYARTIVPGPNGKPVYVVYNSQGEEIVVIGETNTEPLASARVMAGDYYRALLTQWRQVREQYELTDQDLMARDAFLAASFKTIDGKPITTPDLRTDTLWVAVRPEAQRYYTDSAQLVLLELPINPAVSISDETRSLLLGKDGQLLYQTPENIGFRVGFYGSDSGQVKQSGRSYDDTIYGPLRGVYLSLGMAYTGAAITDEQGKYAMTYMLPPCPGFTFTYTTNVYLDLYYKRFNPRGSPNFPYYLMRPGYDFCNGLGALSWVLGEIAASIASPAVRATDFPIDIMALAGKAYVADAAENAIPIGDATRYDGSRKALERAKQDQYDLDGDGQPDKTELGHIVTPEDGSAPYFEKQDQSPEVQGVWLSSVHDVGAIGADLADGQTTTLPDLTRLPDWSADFDDRALLSSLSAADLRDTDLYVFRESDGSLLIERRGLQERETSFVGADANTGRFFYTLQLLGRGEFEYVHSATEYAQFQQAVGLIDPAQYQRQADHLRAGELVRIIAINRPSGYMGSISVPLQAAGTSADPAEISFPIDELIMRPPNLKIWAERKSKVEAGLTQGETREQAIGNEGAGLANDVMISIYTEWLDADGRMLPEALGEYGYTGRLAKVVAANQLAPVTGSFSECDPACDGNQLSQFAIRPGRQLQVVRLPEQVLGKEHLYVQVSGTPSSRNPDFGSGGQSEALTYRPTKFVPVQVPVFDEETTHLGTQAYNGLRNADPNRDLTRPEPFYRFVYRPEFQFSLYDLTVNEIRREDVEGQTTDVLPLDQPVIASSDQLVEIYYDLLGPASGDEPLSPLTPYSYEGERELVFAFGEQEVRATVGADGTLHFDNLDHLGLLNPDDYLTIRLYSNNDASNVLWEWAFGLLSIFPPVQDDGVVIEVPADDADNYTVWASYFSSPSDTEYKWLYWNTSGTATLTPISQGNSEGYYITSVNFPKVAETETKINARMFSPTSPLIAGATFKTVPGAPHTATLTLSGQTAIGGLGGIAVSADIFDAVGNRVKDGTPVFIEASELAVEGNRETVGGKAEFKLIGAQTPGTHEATLRVGNVAKPFTVTVHDVSLAISMPEEIEAGKTVNATITASSAYGDLTGLPIHLGFIRGRADVSDVVLTGNSVTLSVYGGDIRGDGALFAAVANTYIRKDYRVTEPPEVALLDTLLISDVAAPGSVTIGDATYEYTNQTHVVLRGQPGKQLDLSLVDYLDPPMLPLLKYSMQSQPTGTVPDEMLGVPASTSGISRVFSDNNAFTYAYQFSDASTMAVAYTGLSGVNRLGAVFDLYIPAGSEPAGTLLSYADLGLSLSFDGSHRLVWAQTKGAATSSAISQVLTSGRWYQVAAHVTDSGLVLQVDKQIAKAGSLAITNSANKNPLFVGTSFSGKLANLVIFDWDTAKLVRFANGSLNQQAVIPESGVATIPFSSSPLAYAQLEQRRIAYQNEGYSLIRPAYAESATCNAPSVGSLDFFGQPMDASEALFRTMADCQYLPKIKKAWITVQDSSGNVFRRAYALTELSTYVTLYTQLKAAELSINYGPSCANGVLTGKVTDLASATCDFVTSLMVVGDLRDFVLHSYWAWTDEVDEETGKRKFDEATYVFATLGIATTLAEATGIGVTVDAAVAGCKTASKLMKGAPVLLSLASYLKKQVLPHWKDLGQARDAIKKVLPVMQIIALVHYYGEDMADVVYLLGQVTRDQFEGWVNYAAKAILVSDPVIAANAGTNLDFFIHTAIAADRDQILKWLDETGKLEGFAQALKRTLGRAGIVEGELKLNKAYRAKAINSAIDIIGRDFDKMPTADLKNAIAKSEVLSAFAVVYDIEQRLNKSGLMDTLTRFPCTANAGCRLGGVAQAGFTGPEAIAKFFDMITEIAISGKMVDGAQFSKTLEQLGKIQSNGVVNFNMAKGAAEVIGLAARVSRLEGAKILNFEELLNIANQGNRFHDLIVEVNGVVHRIESKAWAPDEALKRLIGSLGGKIDVDDVHDAGGQLWKDLIEALRRSEGSNSEKIKWMFDDRITSGYIFGEGGFFGKLMEQVETNGAMQENLFKALGKDDLLKDPKAAAIFIKEKVAPVLRDIFTAPF